MDNEEHVGCLFNYETNFKKVHKIGMGFSWGF